MAEIQKNTSQPGFTITYRDDGIIIYHLLDVRRNTVDAWVQAFHENEDEALAEGRHLRCIMDIRNAGLPTPYSTAKATELAKNKSEDLPKSYAILIDDSLGAEIMSNAMRRLGKWLNNTRLFTDEQAALDWLDERLAELGE
jgi:hypothetical protein